MVDAVSEMLDQALRKSTGLFAPGATTTVFDARFASVFSIHDYAKKLQTASFCSDECFVLGLVYIDRIMKHDLTFMLTKLNVHRLLLAATVVAIKFQDDDVYGNDFYARIGDVRVTELATVETHLLMMLEWSAHVTPDEYQHCLDGLRRHSLSSVLSHIAEEMRQTPSEAQPFANLDKANVFDMHPPKLITQVQAVHCGPLVTLDFSKKAMSLELSRSEKANAARDIEERSKLRAAGNAEISKLRCIQEPPFPIADTVRTESSSIGETLKKQTKTEDPPAEQCQFR